MQKEAITCSVNYRTAFASIEITFRIAGRCNNQQLVETYPRVAVTPADNALRVSCEGMSYAINDHKIVAEAVHFAEVAHCG